jgi:hypothetical protein
MQTLGTILITMALTTILVMCFRDPKKPEQQRNLWREAVERNKSAHEGLDSAPDNVWCNYWLAEIDASMALLDALRSEAKTKGGSTYDRRAKITG